MADTDKTTEEGLDNSSTAVKVEKYAILKGKLNYTDPIVYHDPAIVKHTVAKLHQGDESPNSVDSTGNSTMNEQVDSKKVDGIWVPIIKLNHLVIDNKQVKLMDIRYDSFLPSMTLIVSDPSESIRKFDTPGMNNEIVVVMIPPVDKVYRSISLLFYATDVTASDDEMIYEAKLNINTFNDIRLGDLTFDNKSKSGICQNGCHSRLCSQNPSHTPNTWEMLHVIASKCKLGFASTDKCKDVNDRLPRTIRNQNFEQYIKEQIKFSGVGTTSMFDAWVDLYGYIVLVNVAYELSEDITIDHLSIIAEEGVRTTSSNTPSSLMKDKLHRTLTNFTRMAAASNLEIDYYEQLSSNTAISGKGTLRTLVAFTPEGVGKGNNSFSSSQAQIVENSLDGTVTEAYTVEQPHTIKSSFNDEYYSTVKQEMLREAFFDKIRAKMLKVKLKKTNFGLQRGTLVQILIYDNTPEAKKLILETTSVLAGNTSTAQNDDVPAKFDKHDFITDDTAEIMNPALSGMYYIDSMEFIYDREYQEIDQYLYLIKKGQLTNYYDLVAHFDTKSSDTQDSGASSTKSQPDESSQSVATSPTAKSTLKA